MYPGIGFVVVHVNVLAQISEPLAIVHEDPFAGADIVPDTGVETQLDPGFNEKTLSLHWNTADPEYCSTLLVTELLTPLTEPRILPEQLPPHVIV